MTTNPECSQCGHLNRPQARFCAQCGSALGNGAVTTPTPNPTPPRPQVTHKRWQRRAGEIAARVDSRDLADAYPKELIVEEGTAAVILQDGQATKLDGPGRYTMQGIFGNLFGRKEITAFLVDSGEISLDFKLDGLWTTDPLKLSGTASIAVQVDNVEMFVRNVVKDRPVVTVHDLRSLLYPEVADAARSFIGGQSVAELESEIAARSEFFGVDIQERLRDALAQSGLKFLRVRLFDLYHERLDQLRGQQESLFLGPQELANRKRLLDLYNQEQIHEIAKEEADIAHFAQRTQLWERMRRAVQSDRMAESRSAEDWEVFLAEAEKRNLLRADELQQTRDAVARAVESRQWSDEDRRRERAHALTMADLYAEYEQRAARLSEQFKEDRGKLDNELELARMEIFGRLEIEQRRAAMTLEREAMEADHRRRQQAMEAAATRELLLADAVADRQRTLEQTQSAAERRRIEIEIEQLEDEADLATAAKAQAMMRQNREEKLRIEREHWIKTQMAQLEIESRQVDLRLKQEAEAHRRQLEAKAQDQQHELARIRELSQASTEVVLSLSGPEQAEFIAEFKRTELFKSMSEEQILAAMIDKRPEVAEVFKAKYQAAAEGKLSAAEAEKWKALAEMAEKQAAERDRLHNDMLDRQDRTGRESAERQERITNEAMRNMADVAKSFAQKNESGPTVVFGPGGSSGGAWNVGGSSGVAGSGKVQVCPQCRVEAPVGVKFCENCGHRFYE